jgi:3-hydroxyanthranilate 3,4-dioxygenase
MKQWQALNFKKWIDEHRHLLKPPVGNQRVFKEGEFIIMVVGGPNARKDFHYNESEEFFYQLEGDMNLKIMDGGKPVDIPIREGEIFLLPPKTPHMPQRPANTIGLVIERQRRPQEKDGLMWFCEKCSSPLHAEYFVLENIVTQFPPLFKKYYSNEALRTCKSCKAVMAPPPGQ